VSSSTVDDAVRPLVSISNVQMRPVEWLLRPLVPMGKLTIVAGQMGQGKSLLSELWAADVTTGANLAEPGSVLMFAAEDDDSDTTLPRLEAAGADAARVFTIKDDALDAARIERYCDELGDVRLLTVDPLTAFFPNAVNPWKTPDVRRFLRPLIELAQRRRFAVVGLLHTNRWSDSADPLTRISEAQGIPQVARSVLVLGPDPAEPEGDRRVLATAKNNLVRGRPSAAFHIEQVNVNDHISAPRLVHEGESTTTARELFGATRKQSPADVFLSAALADGPRLQRELVTEADALGISLDKLRTAKAHIGAVSEKRGLDGWVWPIPTGLEVPT
jgi:putative DNA primase/helicase